MAVHRYGRGQGLTVPSMTEEQLETLIRRVVREELAAADKRLYDAPDAAHALHVSVVQVRRWVRDGELARLQGIRRLLIPAEALAEFAKRRSTASVNGKR